MTITAEAPRGGVAEYIGDTSYVFRLRNREIERFEDKHRGIFELWEGFFERGKKPTSKEVKDILAGKEISRDIGEAAPNDKGGNSSFPPPII